MTQSVHNDNDVETARDTAHFVPLRSETALGELLRRSHVEPVVVFQHDPYCPVSRTAYAEMLDVPVHAALVNVAQDQDLSRTIEEQTGVRHESPQVLLFRSGKVVWNASHLKITRKAVTRAVQHASADEAESGCGVLCRTRAAPQGEASNNASVLSWLRSLWDHQ